MRMRFLIAETVIDLEGEGTYPDVAVSPRTSHFLYEGDAPADIRLRMGYARAALEPLARASCVFSVRHPQTGELIWELFRLKTGFALDFHEMDRMKRALVNRTFDEATIVLPPQMAQSRLSAADLVMDLLLILLMHYWGGRGGIFVHSAGIVHPRAGGFLFIGESQRGKTTISGLWFGRDNSCVLSDDRIAIVRRRGRYLMHASPWHGDFMRYAAHDPRQAPLERIFFLHQATQHSLCRLSPAEAFRRLYPNLFLAFWRKGLLEAQVDACTRLVRALPCYALGFAKDPGVVDYLLDHVQAQTHF